MWTRQSMSSRWLGLTAALLTAGGLAACGSSGTSTTATSSPTPAASSPAPAKVASAPSPCVSGSGNSALGLSVAAFKSKNNTQQPENPFPGDEAYTILKTTKGCVTAFRVDIWTKPNPTAELAVSSIGPQLKDSPGGTSVNPGGGDQCIIWSSATLLKKFGDRYARGHRNLPGDRR